MAPKTWQEAAVAAGVVAMVRDDEVVVNSSDGSSTRKKTPLEYRIQQPQIKESAKQLTMAEKSIFTVKSRLYKRQPKYGMKRNFIINSREKLPRKWSSKQWAADGLCMWLTQAEVFERWDLIRS